MGFGYDEYFTDDELMLDDVAWALKDAGIHMDFIGFDACLMAGIETAAAVSDYAGYLVASEETEPGGGWFTQTGSMHWMIIRIWRQLISVNDCGWIYQ